MSYRAYLQDKDGHFVKAEVLTHCSNDVEAVAAACMRFGGGNIEVWRLDRKVACLKGGKYSDPIR